MKNRRAVGTLAVALTALSIAGCAAETDPAPADDAPAAQVDITEYSDVHVDLDSDHGFAPLPTLALDPNAPEFVMKMLHAIAVRTDQCMAEQGYPAIAGEQDWTPYAGDEDRTLGRWSVSYAQKYGAEPAPESRPAEVDLISRGVEFNKAYGACQDTAKESLSKQIDFAQATNPITDIKWNAYHLAIGSRAGGAAIEGWHQCAEDAGVVLESESGGPSQQYQAQGREAEIRAYTAYAECAHSTGAVQTIFDLRAQYETALMDQQEAQVAEFADQRAAVLAQLDDAIAGA